VTRAIHKRFISFKLVALFIIGYNELRISDGIRVVMAIVFFATSDIIFSQEKSTAPPNHQWAQYYNQIQLPAKWSLNTDLSVRSHTNFSELGQASLRGGISFAPCQTISVAGGLAYFISFQDNLVSERETRAWMEVAFKHPPLNLQHRLRMEDRYFHNLANGSNSSNYRLRYRVYFTFPVNHSTLTNRTLFFLCGNEIFINFRKEKSCNGYDRNRMLSGLGFQLNERFQFTLSYVYQHEQNNNKLNFEETNIFWLGIIHKLSVKKKNVV